LKLTFFFFKKEAKTTALNPTNETTTKSALSNTKIKLVAFPPPQIPFLLSRSFRT